MQPIHPQPRPGRFTTAQLRDPEPLLTRRRAIEATHRLGPEAHGHGDFVLEHDRIMAWFLKVGLQMAGLYNRGRANALRPVVRRVRLAFADLPPGLDGFQILHLSDFHIDGVDGLAEAVAEQVAFLPVDLCVMTGDYRFDVRGPCDRVYPRLQKIMAAVRSRHGVAGILGNHDCADIAIELEKMGVRMLLNEAFSIGAANQQLWVAGVDDPHTYGCNDLPLALAGVPKDGFKLLLAHTPEIFQEADDAGIHIYLSGHTHAGQIRLPGIGPIMQMASCPRAYGFGHWRHGSMQGYTTAGVGCSLLPIRFGCPPEIAVIELVKAQSIRQSSIPTTTWART